MSEIQVFCIHCGNRNFFPQERDKAYCGECGQLVEYAHLKAKADIINDSGREEVNRPVKNAGVNNEGANAAGMSFMGMNMMGTGAAGTGGRDRAASAQDRAARANNAMSILGSLTKLLNNPAGLTDPSALSGIMSEMSNSGLLGNVPGMEDMMGQVNSVMSSLNAPNFRSAPVSERVLEEYEAQLEQKTGAMPSVGDASKPSADILDDLSTNDFGNSSKVEPQQPLMQTPVSKPRRIDD